MGRGSFREEGIVVGIWPLLALRARFPGREGEGARILGSGALRLSEREWNRLRVHPRGSMQSRVTAAYGAFMKNNISHPESFGREDDREEPETAASSGPSSPRNAAFTAAARTYPRTPAECIIEEAGREEGAEEPCSADV
ncbi:hypothetical protein KM043_012225 [Ampulex compressa]|nr:hypothetical protein KM043_012225 [Ampulex compressa]